MKKIILVLCTLILTACTVHASKGRKLLEQQAFELAASLTASNYEYCGSDDSSKNWLPWMEDERALVLVTAEGQMRVTSKARPEGSCYFGFQSQEEMRQKTEAAIQVSLHLSLAK